MLLVRIKVLKIKEKCEKNPDKTDASARQRFDMLSGPL